MSKGIRKERKRKTYEDWLKQYKAITEPLSDEEDKLVKDYLPAIRKGIDQATWEDDFQYIEDLDEKKACLEIEELIYFIPTILRARPSHADITKRVIFFTNNRKNSWLNELINKNEFSSLLRQGLVVEIVEDGIDGTSVDVALKKQFWNYSPTNHNNYNTDSDEILNIKQNLLRIKKGLKSIGSSKRKHAKIYRRILEMMLDDIDVGSEHAAELGIAADEVADFKHQAIEYLQEIVSIGDTELLERRRRCKAQKHKKYKVKKSTLKERKTLYKKIEDDEITKPRTIRIWKVINGKLTIIQDSGEPVSDGKGVPGEGKKCA